MNTLLHPRPRPAEVEVTVIDLRCLVGLGPGDLERGLSGSAFRTSSATRPHLRPVFILVSPCPSAGAQRRLGWRRDVLAAELPSIGLELALPRARIRTGQPVTVPSVDKTTRRSPRQASDAAVEDDRLSPRGRSVNRRVMCPLSMLIASSAASCRRESRSAFLAGSPYPGSPHRQGNHSLDKPGWRGFRPEGACRVGAAGTAWRSVARMQRERRGPRSPLKCRYGSWPWMVLDVRLSLCVREATASSAPRTVLAGDSKQRAGGCAGRRRGWLPMCTILISPGPAAGRRGTSLEACSSRFSGSPRLVRGGWSCRPCGPGGRVAAAVGSHCVAIARQEKQRALRGLEKGRGNPAPVYLVATWPSESTRFAAC